jgi:hypothetical protein
LGPAVLEAINQVTGKNYRKIEHFNDSHWTDHTMVLTALARARENIAAGRFAMPAESPIQVSLFRRSWNRMTAWFDSSI